MLIAIDGNSQISGGDGNDIISADSEVSVQSQSVTRSGDDGDDLFKFFDPSSFGSSLDGGAGTDTFDFSGQDFITSVDLATETYDENGLFGQSIINVENIIANDRDNTLIGNDVANSIKGGDGDDAIDGGAGNDQIFGEAGDDTLNGGEGNDTVNGGEGADVLDGGEGDDMVEGGAGPDTLDGGDGIDTLSYLSSGTGVTVRLFNETATGGDATGDTFTDFENVIGSGFDDILRGDSVSNTLDGDDGDDRLSGLEGDDTLIGGYGDDILLGGEGADVLNGGSGHDIASYSNATKRVVVDLNNTAENKADAAGDTYFGIEQIDGSDFNDLVRLDDNVQYARGNGGDDRIFGGSSDNNLFGDDGNDLLSGGDGYDILQGGSGDDVLMGGDKDDTLIGGAGRDELEGGEGSDIFRFLSVTDSGTSDLDSDVITDMVSGTDEIDLSALGVESFLGDGAFTGSGNEVRFETIDDSTARLLIDIDGDQSADMMIMLTNFTGTLSQNDFFLID